MKELISIFNMIALILEMTAALGYRQEDIVVHHYKQRVYLIEVNSEKGGEVQGTLSHDSIFGFESIGTMATKKSAVAAVNGMFFDDLGSPAGLLCENGRWIRITDIGTPSLVLGDQPSIQEITVQATWRNGQREGVIEAFNVGAYHGLVNIFTKDYGLTNRVFRPQVTYRVMGNRVVQRYLTDEPIETEQGYLITYLLPEHLTPEQVTWQTLPAGIPCYEIGEECIIDFSVKDNDGSRIDPKAVYQTGGWLLKNGKSEAKPYEKFIGYTTSLQPRTAVGINRKGNLVFCVADGRQKGTAEGLSGQWLAEVMWRYDILDAAYLDGGASSMMWVQGSLVNTPAYSDRENGKEIAHSILFGRADWEKQRKRRAENYIVE